MGKQARFNFIGNGINENLTVNLLDTKGATAWAYAVLLNEPLRTINDSYWTRLESFNDDQASGLLSQVKNLVRFLHNTPFAYTSVLPDSVNNITRNFLNDIHRHFTNSSNKLWSGSLRFEPTQQHEIHSKLLHLNQVIHSLEHMYPNSTQTKFQSTGKEIILRPREKDNAIGFDIKPYANYHSYDSYDVILDPYVLGKTIIQSFLDHDDPTQWDTAGHVITDGGCMFVLDDHRKRVYESQEYVNWLNSYGLNYYNTYADYPLGNFVGNDKARLIEMSQDSSFNSWECTITVSGI